MDVFKQPPMVQLSKTGNKYYVDGNGNHRIAAYKMMYLADLAHEDWQVAERAKHIYWLNAKIHMTREQYNEWSISANK